MMRCLFVSWLFVLAACATSIPEDDKRPSSIVDSLFNNMLRLERTVAIMSTELKTMASMQESMKSALQEKDALLANITRSLGKYRNADPLESHELTRVKFLRTIRKYYLLEMDRIIFRYER